MKTLEEKIKELFDEHGREEVHSAVQAEFVKSPFGVKPTPYEECLRAHANECGTCLTNGTFIPCT